MLSLPFLKLFARSSSVRPGLDPLPQVLEGRKTSLLERLVSVWGTKSQAEDHEVAPPSDQDDVSTPAKLASPKLPLVGYMMARG